jgi:NAD(P)-dependent dehydrogenase (short-subunit alcohol dehydrogenase family)
MSALFDLSGKRALITGGTHGLGMAMAKGLGQAGAHLLINGHSPAKMEQALAGTGAKALPLRAICLTLPTTKLYTPRSPASKPK